ncbi:neuritin, partial [Python bivittatus]|uniref:Neuritin n=1 Tax=Python bivittatus TaxID=176946 RepID=A0A9F2WJB1_PYTBI
VLAYLVQAVKEASKCDAVFKGFSDCVVKMGQNIASYPQDLDDKKNLETICRYWDDFHSCTLTALTDCQEGLTDVWEKLKEKSKKLDYEGNLFVLCGKTNGAASSVVASASPVLLVALSAALATCISM